MAHGSYYVNPAARAQADIWEVLKTLASVGENGCVCPVTIYQDENDQRWVLATQGKEFKDLSLNRVIERAGRSLTTVYEK